jgi:hypothetical protein
VVEVPAVPSLREPPSLGVVAVAVPSDEVDGSDPPSDPLVVVRVDEPVDPSPPRALAVGT